MAVIALLVLSQFLIGKIAVSAKEADGTKLTSQFLIGKIAVMLNDPDDTEYQYMSQFLIGKIAGKK